jgi:hypothetical protein
MAVPMRPSRTLAAAGVDGEKIAVAYYLLVGRR